MLTAVGSSPTLSGAGTVYWIGADGNIYNKTSAGVTNLGASTGNSTAANLTLNGATQISDPNPGNPVAPTTTTGTTAPTNPNGAAAPKVLNQAAVNNTQGTLDQLPGSLASALGSENQNYANTNAGFNSQEGQQRTAYDSGSVTNQQNYDSNYMDSIRAGIKGLGGLMAVLRGSGAAGGSADDEVQNTVGGITSDDIRTGRDTRQANQGQLDSSLGSFLTELSGKRQANKDTHANNEAAINRDSATQMQDLYSKMAGYYGDAGDTGNANAFMARAGALTPTIAANSRTQTGAYDTSPVVIHAPNLTSFAAPTQPDAATASQDGQVGSGIFSMNSNKRKDAAPTPTAPVAIAQGA